MFVLQMDIEMGFGRAVVIVKNRQRIKTPENRSLKIEYLDHLTRCEWC